MSAPSDDNWPEGSAEDGNKFFSQDKLSVPEDRVENLIDDWHNAQLMHRRQDKLQKDLELRFCSLRVILQCCIRIARRVLFAGSPIIRTGQRLETPCTRPFLRVP